MGFWNALREVFPQAREGRCWFHKTANVLAALPKSAHPGAKKAVAEIWGAEDKDHAVAAVKAFDDAYGGRLEVCVVSGLVAHCEAGGWLFRRWLARAAA